jgi:hypothetical protein
VSVDAEVAGYVFGVPSLKWVHGQDRVALAQALGECGPGDDARLAHLARRLCEAHSDGMLAIAADAIKAADLGPARRRLLALGYRRVAASIALIGEFVP